MASQAASSTRSPVPTTPQTRSHNTPQPTARPPPFKQNLGDTRPISRSRPAHTQSAPTLSTHTPTPPCVRQALNTQHPNAIQSERAASTGAPERFISTRGYSVHMPHNPNRPPPYTYQRQHEFPPFPPLAQHPVLPFLTTAFSSQPDAPVAPTPKPRTTIAPRASTTQRHVHSNLPTIPIPTMDVSKHDPTAIFVRPPLVVPLPRGADPSIRPEVLIGNSSDSEPIPGTPLTYAVLHNHRNWFLDADDFRKDNPNRIDYPPNLEPPRGWAPLAECTGAGAAGRCKQAKETKEKSRTKGSYAHGENAVTDTTVEYGPSDDCHEKTVLRCTFCRREYHGPNAKSMWRRHVYDKHKVAMKNRREGSAGMAPKVPLPKKGKSKVAASSQSLLHLGSPVALDAPAPTLDLTNEQNLIRLLERVVSGNLDISLPASLLNSRSSADGTAGINLEAIALALQRSGISLTLEKAVNSISKQSLGSKDFENPYDAKMQQSGNPSQKERQNTGNAHEGNGAVKNEQLSSSHSSTVIEEQVTTFWIDDSPQSSASAGSLTARRSTAPSPLSSDTQFYGQKRKANGGDYNEQPRDRAPLKDNTTFERNNHNSNARAVPGTPRKDKGKQKALPRTPGCPKMTQSISPISSSPRNPYTPRSLSANALRARALATTGQESYLTLVLSSPGTASPVRSTGRVSFTSPFSRRMSPTKANNDDHAPPSDDPLGILGTSSPRYPFDFNIQGTQNSPSYMTAFDPIPLESGTLSPAHWTPPVLGPPAPVSEPTSQSISRTSSVARKVEPGEDRETDDEDQDMQLEYPEWSSPSERLRRRPGLDSRLLDVDFDMDDFLDLDNAAPALGANITSPPIKAVVSRGFSKEFGLLSPEEVERITASVRVTFEEEVRSSKRQKVDCSS